MMHALLEPYKKKYPHIKYVDLVPGKEEAPRMDYEALSEGYDGNVPELLLPTFQSFRSRAPRGAVPCLRQRFQESW